MKVKSLSHVQLCVTPWTVAYQASPSMGFSSQEYRSGLTFPSPGDLPDPGIEPRVSRIVGRRFTIWATLIGNLCLLTTFLQLFSFTPQPLVSLSLTSLSLLCFLFFWDSIYIGEFIHFVFFLWLSILNIMLSRSVCPVPNGRISSLLNIPLCIYATTLFIHSLVDN